MKNIVLLIGSYYPNCSAVGRCMGNLADVLEKEYNVTVVAQITETSEKLLDYRRKQKIIRIKTKDIYRDMYCREQIKRKKKIFVLPHKYYQIKRVMHAILSRNSIIKKNVNAYLEALESLNEVPDYIVPTCNPFETITAALRYKQKHKACKVVPVIFDMFAISGRVQRFAWNQKIKLKQNQMLERWMFEESDRVLHMPSWTSYIASFFAEYKNKCFEVEHPLLVRPDIQNIIEDGHCIRTDVSEKEKIELVFAGALIRDYVEADYLLELLNFEAIQKKCEMRFFSTGDASDIIEKAKINVINYGWVAHDELVHQLESANILVSIAEKAGKQISSKIFEYMSLGKPILHIYYADLDVNLHYLQRYPLALCIKAETECLDQNQTVLYEWINKNYNSSVPYEYTMNKFEEMTPEFIVKKIMG